MGRERKLSALLLECFCAIIMSNSGYKFFLKGLDIMKILVLGNGFDLDHNLPTSYMDFLNFCNYVLDMDNPDSIAIQKLKPSQIKYAEVLKSCEPIKSTFLSFLKNNHLLSYFNTKVATQGVNWIDFEREIKSIVNEFKTIEFKLKQSNKYCYHTDSNHKVHQILEALDLSNVDRELWNEISLSAIHKDLCHSLNSFSSALEYYISYFVNETPHEGVSPDIIDFQANKVLTFNYSNTYERLYGGIRWDESIDHVHGLANTNLYNEPNIILGITTYEENLQNYYVEFEKYFQRITKRTGNEYKKWLQQRKGINEKIEVMFFGHSLDATDSDIIRDLISHDNSVVKIYYFNEQTHQQIVANLIEIIGKDNLIESVSGANPKIEFVKQREHRIDNTAGIEITRDIRLIYGIHRLQNNEINNLLSKLKTKIKEKDLSYFYSQKKVISLFEAIKYYELEIAEQDTFFEICKKLDFEKRKNGKVKFYDEEEWYDHTPWGEEIPCDKETTFLINRINNSNKKRFQETETSKPYAKILTMESSNEIKDALIELFKEDNPNDIYWKQLEELFGLMYKNSFFEDALVLIEQETLPLSVSSKFKYFKNEYYEHCFNIDYEKQMAEAYQYEENN